jgi:hypothetical protein
MTPKEEIMKDLLALQRIGLIEVVGINDEGEELWGPTVLGRSLEQEQVDEIIDKSIDDGI